MPKYYPLVLVLFAVSSCIDQKDYDLHAVSVSPSLAIPLVSGNLSVLGILSGKDSAFIKIASDSLVYVEYSNALVSSDIRNLFTLSDKTINESIALPPGTIPAHTKDIRGDSLTALIDFGLSPEKLNGIDFKSGMITYSTQLLPGTSHLSYEVILSSTDFVSKSTHQTLSIVAGSGSLSMSDYDVTLTNNKFNLKMVAVFKGPSAAVVIGPNTSIAVTFSMTGMNFNSITGFFGDQTVSLPPTTINLGAFGSSLHTANVSFAQPVITLNVISDYGVPCQASFSTFEAQKTGASIAALINPANPVTITPPAVLGNSATTPITITNTKQMIDFGPTSFYYDLSARINKGLVSGNDFLSDTSKLRVNLDIKIPLDGYGSKITLTDTSKIDLSKVSQSAVSQASLKVTITNQLPLDANVQLYLTDDKYVILDSLLTSSQTALIKGSTVTAGGTLLAAGTVDELLPLNSVSLNKLFTSGYVIIRAVMNTTGKTVDVKFKSNYTMQVNLGLLADLKFNVTF